MKNPARRDFRLVDYFLDDTTGKASGSKLWVHIGNAAIVIVYMYDAMVLNNGFGAEKAAVVGAVVCGNSLINRWITKRYVGGSNSSSKGKFR